MELADEEDIKTSPQRAILFKDRKSIPFMIVPDNKCYTC
jgi:hypothetical protein